MLIGLKLKKREMYCKVSFDLLRRKVCLSVTDNITKYDEEPLKFAYYMYSSNALKAKRNNSFSQ